MQLARGEVHVWSVPLDVSPETSAGLYETLGEDEQSRSARFRFERDRRRFIVARGSLRELLTRYLATPPGQLRFVYNTFGKPGLSPECGRGLRFNISHSADLALIAIALDAEVGVDLEHLRALPDYAEIARGFFSPAEVDELTRLPSGLQAQAFFRCWTKKEAYAKARGEGLASNGTPPTGRCSLHTFQPAPGYVAALVVEGVIPPGRILFCPNFPRTRSIARARPRSRSVSGPKIPS